MESSNRPYGSWRGDTGFRLSRSVSMTDPGLSYWSRFRNETASIGRRAGVERRGNVIVSFSGLAGFALAASLGLASATFGATAADERVALLAGFARADITPPVEMLNWTLTPPRPYGEVHDPLFVRALVLADGRNRVVLVGWD